MSPQVEKAERTNTMPKRLLIPIALIACMAMPSPSSAQDSRLGLKPSIRIPDCIRKWCCDDYCPKPLPCPVPVQCFSSDCYRAKLLPCPVAVKRFSCDDYCLKPFPSICCPPSQFLTCAPPLRSSAPTRIEAPQIRSNAEDAQSSITRGKQD
jgi:hypothetical protein